MDRYWLPGHILEFMVEAAYNTIYGLFWASVVLLAFLLVIILWLPCILLYMCALLLAS